MTDLRLSAREAEDVLAGRQPDGRADLAALAEVAAVLHASREVEPPPPISDSLRAQIDGGVPNQAETSAVSTVRRRRRHRPRHMQAVEPSTSSLAAYRRPVVSVAAAAVLLVGLVLATSRGNLPGDVHSAVSDMGSAIGLDLFRQDDAAPAGEPAPTTTTSSTTTMTVPPTTAAPPTSAAPPPTTAAPAGPPPDGSQLPWWLDPQAWQFGFDQWSGDGQWGGDRDGNYSRDGDRDGDGDGTGAGSGSGDGRNGMTQPDGPADSSGTTLPSTTAEPTSTSISPPSTATGSTGTPSRPQ
jgi:hypothetical protein